jgi:hypothetical protein
MHGKAHGTGQRQAGNTGGLTVSNAQQPTLSLALLQHCQERKNARQKDTRMQIRLADSARQAPLVLAHTACIHAEKKKHVADGYCRRSTDGGGCEATYRLRAAKMIVDASSQDIMPQCPIMGAGWVSKCVWGGGKRDGRMQNTATTGGNGMAAARLPALTMIALQPLASFGLAQHWKGTDAQQKGTPYLSSSFEEGCHLRKTPTYRLEVRQMVFENVASRTNARPRSSRGQRTTGYRRLNTTTNLKLRLSSRAHAAQKIVPTSSTAKGTGGGGRAVHTCTTAIHDTRAMAHTRDLVHGEGWLRLLHVGGGGHSAGHAAPPTPTHTYKKSLQLSGVDDPLHAVVVPYRPGHLHTPRAPTPCRESNPPTGGQH